MEKTQKKLNKKTKNKQLKAKPKLNTYLVAGIILAVAAAGGLLLYRTYANGGSIPKCAKGSKAVGYATAYRSGRASPILLCEITGFRSTGSEDRGGYVRVGSKVSGRWVGLYNAAKRDKKTLVASSSFRSHEKQKWLRYCYESKKCNGGNFAERPGYSSHQSGEAVDIDIVAGAKDPTLTACKKNPSKYPTYKWLTINAPWAGLFARIDTECWHWSSTGY